MQLTYLRQNESLLPWPLNTSVNSSIALFNATSRPTRDLTLQARYRYNKHDNKTAPFDGRHYVRFDSAPEDIGNPLEPEEGFSEILPDHPREPRRQRHLAEVAECQSTAGPGPTRRGNWTLDNDSDNAFNYGGPRIAALQTTNAFIALPNVVNA